MTLEEMLIYDEGRVLKVYWDHLGYPTVGIGHLIIPPEDNRYDVNKPYIGQTCWPPSERGYHRE